MGIRIPPIQLRPIKADEMMSLKHKKYYIVHGHNLELHGLS